MGDRSTNPSSRLYAAALPRRDTAVQLPPLPPEFFVAFLHAQQRVQKLGRINKALLWLIAIESGMLLGFGLVVFMRLP